MADRLPDDLPRRPINPLDFYAITADLTDEEHALRDRVRAFVDTEVVPVIDQHAEDATFPHALVPKLAALGVFRPTANDYGAPGISHVAHGLICQELERGDSSLRTFATVQGTLTMFAIHEYGTAEQKRLWQPRLIAGEAIGCFAMTEPGAGSDPAGIATRATAVGDAYELTGQKAWITNGSIADVAVVWARDPDGEVQGYLVEKGAFSAADVIGSWSLRASISSDLAFDRARAQALPGARGLKTALRCLSEARYDIAWGALGAAQHCFEIALDYAKHRVQFGHPIGAFQLVQEKLVWMINELTKGQLLALQLGHLKTRDSWDYVQASLAKLNNTRVALEIARSARDILGAQGMSSRYPIFRHMKNLEALITYNGTSDIHTLIVGRAITGLSAFA
jgi:glutaryl-CoA dehydrogenase